MSAPTIHPASLDRYLSALIERNASDMLFSCGAPPWLRVDGSLVPMGDEPLTPEDTEAIAAAVLTEDLRAQLDADKDVDLSFNWDDRARFRVNVFHQRGSLGIAVRLIPYQIPTLDDLAVPSSAQSLVEASHGLVLVTGPTGSGKSTTLAAMIDHINATRPCHILTIEDPIEYVHRHKRAAVNQREIGEDAASFPRALRAALREDPDVILVGEMRDLDTIRSALSLAETGHLVLATLHTNDAPQAVDRIVDVFPAEQQTQIRVQLASTLTGVVYQRLVPRVNGGRVAAYEVLIATYAVRNLIKEGQTRQLRNALMTGQRDGMQTLEASLSELVAAGEVDHQAAVAGSAYPNEIARSRIA